MLSYNNTDKLDGIWSFAFINGAIDEEQISTINYNEVINVPSCFDALDKYFGKRGSGVYKTFFFATDKIIIKFHAIGLRAKVFLDGKKLGEIPFAFTPYSFFVDNLKATTHELIVVTENIIEENDASMFHENYDFYGFGGIYKSIEVRHLDNKSNYFEDAQVTTLDYDKGIVKIKINMSNDKETVVNYYFDGKKQSSIVVNKSYEFECHVPNHNVWSPDYPQIHKLCLKSSEDCLKTTFGIRQIMWQNGELLLNNQPIKLSGICRHDSHVEFGYAMPENLIFSDLKMIKEQGFNFIRGSHYPQSEFMLDCCDRLGILVCNESCGWGNCAENCANTCFIEKQIKQAENMVNSSYNHPSIIIWGFMNELDSTSKEAYNILDKLVKTLHTLDKSRPVTYASMHLEKDICYELVDIISTNVYPGWYGSSPSADDSEQVIPCLSRLEKFFSQEKYCNKPWIISEIGAEAICGSYSGLRWSEEYQEKIISLAMQFFIQSKRCNGLALWHFADCNTYLGSSNTYSRPRGFNNKGLLNEYRKPKLSWRVAKKYNKTIK